MRYTDFGIPDLSFVRWMEFSEHPLNVELPNKSSKPLKNPEVPILKSYKNDPGPDFWKHLPFNPLPEPDCPYTPIDVICFKELYEEHEILLKNWVKSMALKTFSDIEFGADSLVDCDNVQPLYDVNSKSMYRPDIGSFYTDTLTTMLKKQFVAGPFDEPPFDNLRVNSLFCVEQPNKLRPILNLSAPKGISFNDMIEPGKMTKVVMSSPVNVARKISILGRQTFMSKIDHVSAYKLIPTKYGHLFLQGFYWMGKFFVETAQIFGACSSVPSYDRFHLVFLEIVKAHTKQPSFYFERQLDDAIIIAPNFEICKQITDTYIEFAERINLPLAPTDDKEKAFLNSQSGVVLGIHFNAKNMSWSLPESKYKKYRYIIASVINKCVNVTQKELQQVLGIINNLTLISKSLKFLRAPIVSDLKKTYDPSCKCQECPKCKTGIPVNLSVDTISFLHKWMFILDELFTGFPIPKFPDSPPVLCDNYVTDAAGGAMLKKSPNLQVGVGAVGYNHLTGSDKISSMTFYGQAFWPKPFVVEFKDMCSRSFGNKTTLLECMGLIIPLYHQIKRVKGQHVVIHVDNKAVMFAYQNGRSRKDVFTSLIIFVIEMICTTFKIRLYVYHVKRVSTLPALLADTLTRTDPKGRELVDSLHCPIQKGWPPSLLAWMQKPTVDWSLGLRVVADFRRALSGPCFWSNLQLLFIWWF